MRDHLSLVEGFDARMYPQMNPTHEKGYCVLCVYISIFENRITPCLAKCGRCFRNAIVWGDTSIKLSRAENVSWLAPIFANEIGKWFTNSIQSNVPDIQFGLLNFSFQFPFYPTLRFFFILQWRFPCAPPDFPPSWLSHASSSSHPKLSHSIVQSSFSNKIHNIPNGGNLLKVMKRSFILVTPQP